ncbi:MAG: hypothetical protein E7667_05000 [Ruminococcaceae bacterium]|nr:hypothetical protein [Oscillospiraceae bacterium]
MFRSVTLEMSIKPFKQTDDEYIRSVCKKVFEQWHALLKSRQEISIMLWTSEGGEILDYTGELDREFEWAYWLGHANMPELSENDSPSTSLHDKKQKYIDTPPKMTYRILQKIVAAIKSEGKKYFPNSKITVGATFDIGPEFAISDFKYNRHPESCNGTGCGVYGLVDCTALLHADDYPYAAYPNGIPEGTPMGTFFGKQANIFLSDMGFDYIWLSNGMGFCYEPWNELGKIYDGDKFHAEKLPDTREKVFLFWKYFREACPDFPIQTRGTNYSVGIDYASDGVPLYDIYNGKFNITPPPNSPWAAINDDIGIEILGQLTRNAEIPENDYMFRYYLHDIWWANSPWYDRYEGSPHDIYIPMSLSRITKDGRIHSPTLFHILSIDNSKGQLPDNCANEVIPHILKAEKEAPDDIAPVTLVYPFREYTTNNGDLLSEMYFGDRFLQNSLNSGLPLSCVISTDNIDALTPAMYKKTVLVIPARFENNAAWEKIHRLADNGAKIILYGSFDSLSKVKINCPKVDIFGDTQQIMNALAYYGYKLRFMDRKDTLIGGYCHDGETKKESELRESERLFASGKRMGELPSTTIHRHNNAKIFSIYNRDNTVETQLKFPLGAPIFDGYDAYIENGYATYRFDRCAHRECRVFVKQESGKVSVRECPPVNGYFRRKIRISGLENAEVCLFPESYCANSGAVVATLPHALDDMPAEQEGWSVVNDAEHGTYLHKANVTGTIYLCMPHKDKMK